MAKRERYVLHRDRVGDDSPEAHAARVSAMDAEREEVHGNAETLPETPLLVALADARYGYRPASVSHVGDDAYEVRGTEALTFFVLPPNPVLAARDVVVMIDGPKSEIEGFADINAFAAVLLCAGWTVVPPVWEAAPKPWGGKGRAARGAIWRKYLRGRKG